MTPIPYTLDDAKLAKLCFHLTGGGLVGYATKLPRDYIRSLIAGSLGIMLDDEALDAVYAAHRTVYAHTDPPDQVVQVEPLATYAGGKLWGTAGGELEFVSQRVEYRKQGTRHEPVLVMRFTDHDAQAMPHDVAGLIDGKYYEIEFPMAAY